MLFVSNSPVYNDGEVGGGFETFSSFWKNFPFLLKARENEGITKRFKMLLTMLSNIKLQSV